ncbi:unnamed protein product [Amoebophrya sp. A25]|nr:unnamed protein product [Amoebophrya sp. A25]|eukprot:GSA25T00019736001.1
MYLVIFVTLIFVFYPSCVCYSRPNRNIIECGKKSFGG